MFFVRSCSLRFQQLYSSNHAAIVLVLNAAAIWDTDLLELFRICRLVYFIWCLSSDPHDLWQLGPLTVPHKCLSPTLALAEN